VITQLLGTATAVLVVRWGWREFRRDWRDERRLPLVTGPYLGGRTLLALVGSIVALVPILIGIVKLELVPKSSPAQIVAMFVWLSLGFVFAIFGVLSREARRAAKGWIHVVGDDAVRIETDGATATLRLRAGAARLRFLEDGPSGQHVQLDLEDGATRAHVWGMVGMRDTKLVTPRRPAQPEGLMVATSMSPLCRWLAPYLTKE